MRWTYHIAHEWPEGERMAWADIWLMPEKDLFHGHCVFLTIDALGDPDNPEHGSERREFRDELLEKLGDKEYLIDGTDMTVRVTDFSRSEFLEWVGVWIRAVDPGPYHLVEGTYEDFKKIDAVTDSKESIFPESGEPAGPAEV